MKYFSRIENYNTYEGNGYDFHFDYNANKGGGQNFLGGAIRDQNGREVAPSILENYRACFKLVYRTTSGNQKEIDLGTDSATNYSIVPRSPESKTSNSMKLKIEFDDGRRIRPSLLFPALLMLPETCTINNPASPGAWPIATKNYWLRSMWLDCDYDTTSRTAYLIPRDLVFSGFRPSTNSPEDPYFFKLSFNERINDILLASSTADNLPDPIPGNLKLLADTLTGKRDFSYSECRNATNGIMQALPSEYPEYYWGYGDPLPAILELRRLSPSTKCPESINRPYNLIYAGAPGTGKSYQLNQEAQRCFPEKNRRRVTFYPDYTYSQFVGCFKPYSETEDDNSGQSKKSIEYEFVPGPFMETYSEAWRHPDENYLLIIEEINRANPAAVFGDLFQLLDRKDGISEYPIKTPYEMRMWLEMDLGKSAAKLPVDPATGLSDYDTLKESASELRLPSNLYIWATMNSADQGVFPMDTAFKRRWDFKYIGIDDGEDVIKDKTVRIGEPARTIHWNDLRKCINAILLKAGVNEDKLLGPFFINPSDLDDKDRFNSLFKDKVLLYLFEDAARSRRARVFAGEENQTYSAICKKFDEDGDDVFTKHDRIERLDKSEAQSAEEAG